MVGSLEGERGSEREEGGRMRFDIVFGSPSCPHLIQSRNTLR